MFPIFEQNSGRGIGYGLDSFLNRFQAIIIEHFEANGTKSFAFIFYDFENHDIKTILKDQGVFAKLDRLSGNELSVFYLHSGSKHSIERFNSALMDAMGVKNKARPPCVIFCKVSKSAV